MSEAPSDLPVPACPYCGGERFTDGDVAGFSYLQFSPRLSGGRRPGPKPVQARVCDRCGNVQLYVSVPPGGR